jgi:hypothetical protein
MTDTTITFPRSPEPLTPLLNNPSPTTPQEPLTPLADNATPASTSNISPTAAVLSQLQQSQEQNPGAYSAVATSIAIQLTAHATTTQSNGNTTEANTLNQLATVFQSSAKFGRVPTAHVLQRAGLSGHHPHRGHHATSSPGDSIASLLATAISKAIGS